MSDFEPDPRGKARRWLSSLAAASFVTLLLVVLLSSAHRKPPPPKPAEEQTSISFRSVSSPEESAAPPASASRPNLSSILPATLPSPVTTFTIDAPALDISVDLPQILQWRYSYADLGEIGNAANTFGMSNLSDMDGSIESILLPPERFPEELIRAGVYEGRVVVTLLINKKGHASVKTVHSSTNQQLVPIVVESLNRSIYSVPLRNGKPTSTLIRRVVVFKANPERINLINAPTIQ